MNKLSIVQYGNELVATFIWDDNVIFIRGEATKDFIYDCANLILEIEEKMKNEKHRQN